MDSKTTEMVQKLQLLLKIMELTRTLTLMVDSHQWEMVPKFKSDFKILIPKQTHTELEQLRLEDKSLTSEVETPIELEPQLTISITLMEPES